MIRGSIFVIGAMALASVAGAVVGTTLQTDPIERQSATLDDLPNHPFNALAGNADRADLSPPPGHVSVMKVDGEVRYTARVREERYAYEYEYDDQPMDGGYHMYPEEPVPQRAASAQQPEVVGSVPMVLEAHPATGRKLAAQPRTVERSKPALRQAPRLPPQVERMIAAPSNTEPAMAQPTTKKAEARQQSIAPVRVAQAKVIDVASELAAPNPAMAAN